MQVVIFGTVAKEVDLPYIHQLFNVLNKHGINAYVYAPYLAELLEFGELPASSIAPFESYLDFAVKKIDFVITLGGDGTILKAITLIRDTEVPILGINLGRLGFLASIEKTKIETAIELLKRGMYAIHSRATLMVESNKPAFDDLPFALNDFTILKRDTSSMVTIHTYINGEYLNTYWADGIIVATPTGSTGYSLSCGGPILFPNSGNFVITPVAPHNLNVRPIVIDDQSVISFEIEGRTENFLATLDSRFETITQEYELAVRKGDFSVKLVQLQDASFLNTLRNKLNWGADRRN